MKKMEIDTFLNNCEDETAINVQIEKVINEDELEDTKKMYSFDVEELPNKIFDCFQNCESDKLGTLISILYLFAQKIDKVKYIDTYYNTIYVTKKIIMSEKYTQYVNCLKEEEEKKTEVKRVNWAFRKWINICMNYDADISVRTYFDIININPEDEILNVLFYEKRNLRDNFKCDKKLNYILPVVADWFLKRYNIKDYKKINNKYIDLNKNIKCKYLRKKFPFKSFIPRLMAGIIVGYIPLIGANDIWNWLLSFDWIKLVILALVSVFLSMYYLFTEINHSIIDKKECRIRTAKIFKTGVVESVALGFLVSWTFGAEMVHSIEKFENYDYNIFNPTVILVYPALALLFGIFLQIIWEDKPITHPI